MSPLPVEEGHVAIIAVGGSTFAHFLPLFGAGPEDARQFALKRRVACVLDSDPCMKLDGESKWKACWPYCEAEVSPAEFRAISPVVERLREVTRGVGNITVECGSKTFEYDLAESNPHAAWLISERAVRRNLLLALCEDPAGNHDTLMAQLDKHARAALAKVADPTQRQAMTFASLYLLSVEERKGENAFDVAIQIRLLAPPTENPNIITVPGYVRNAIEFVSPALLEEAA